MTPGFAKSRQDLPWLYYPRTDRVIINAHNFTPPAPALTGTFVSAPPTPTRNDFGGSLGFRFIAASSWSLKALGRYVGSIFAQSHQVKLWSDGGTQLASVTITTGSPADGSDWRYEMLGTPYSIVSGTAYRVGVTEFASGDNWQNEAVVGSAFNATYGNTFQGYYSVSANVFPNTSASVLRAYCWPQLYY